MFDKTTRTAIFIDGSNLYAASKALGFDLDYKRLRDHLDGLCQMQRLSYYATIFDDEEFSPIRPLIDYLAYNGFNMVTKPVNTYTDALGNRKVKGGIDVEITTDAMEIADCVDHIVIFSGNGDFTALIGGLQRQGVRVTVVSTIRSQPSMCSDDLRRAADEFIELDTLRPIIARPPRAVAAE